MVKQPRDYRTSFTDRELIEALRTTPEHERLQREAQHGSS